MRLMAKIRARSARNCGILPAAPAHVGAFSLFCAIDSSLGNPLVLRPFLKHIVSRAQE